MNWLSILGVIAIVVAVISVLGFTPRGGRPVARTQLMTMARVVLVLLGLILLYLAYKT